MRKIKFLTTLCLLALGFAFQVSAQNGNLVISEVQAYSVGNDVAVLEVRASGNLAGSITGGTFTLTDESRAGIGFLSVASVDGNTVLMTGTFNMTPTAGNQPQFVDLSVQVPGASNFTGRRLVRFPTEVINQGR